MNRKPNLYTPVAVAVAFVMIGATFLIAPTTEAGSHCSSLGAASISTTPIQTTVGPRQGITYRDITIAYSGTGDVDRVVFEFDTTLLFWEPTYSSALGWDVQANNEEGPAVPHSLTFTSRGYPFLIGQDSPIADPTVPNPVTFSTAFRVGGARFNGPADIMVTVYRQGCPATPAVIPIVADTDRPEVLPGGALTLDLDSNGKLDAMLVTFNELIDRSTYTPDTFEVRDYEIVRSSFVNMGGTVDAYVPYLNELYAGNTWYGECTEPRGCSQILLELKEKTSYDTGVMPELRASSVDLTDLAGNRLANLRSSLDAVVDGAPPLLVAAIAHNTDDVTDTYEQIRLQFSEDVQWSNNPGLLAAGSYSCAPDNLNEICVVNPRPCPPTGPCTVTPHGGTTSGAVPGDNRPRAAALCPREPTYWQLRPQAFEYYDNNNAGNGGTTQTALSPPNLVLATTVPSCGGTYRPISQFIQHPPCYVRDLECDPGNEFSEEPNRPMDLAWADIILDVPLSPQDTDPEAPDFISCGKVDSTSGPSSGHVRDMGNGGNLTHRAAHNPFASAEAPDDPGPGMTCDPSRRIPILNAATAGTAIRATTDIWATHAIVHFPFPVAGYDPEEQEEEIEIQPGSFDVVTTNAGGPRGIIGIEHEPCSRDVKLLFRAEQKVLPTDVDDTPTKIRIMEDKIRVCGAGLTPNIFDIPQKISQIDVPLRDVYEPRIREAHTVDQDQNGIVDAYHIRWSEPIDDSTYCDGDVHCPRSSYISLVDRAGALYRDMGPQLPFALYGPYNFDTGDVVDDDVMLIKWAERLDPAICPDIVTMFFTYDPEATGQSIYSLTVLPSEIVTLNAPVLTNQEDFAQGTDFRLDALGRIEFLSGGKRPDQGSDVRVELRLRNSQCDRTVGHPEAIHSGMTPDLMVAPGLVMDLVPTGEVEVSPNPSANMWHVTRIWEADRAAPVIWRAQTVDRETNVDPDDDDCMLNRDRSPRLRPACEPAPDGMIDGYRITFSEPVFDAIGEEEDDLYTFRTANWAVEGYTVTGMSLENREGDGWYDDVMLLDIQERPDLRGDTGDKPELTYKQVEFELNPWYGIRDHSGNLLGNVETRDVAEEDDAMPVIWAVEGFVGSRQLNITFSEPVDDGVGKPVVRADLTYANRNGPVGVAGFAISTRSEPGVVDPAEVKHEPGSKFAVVPLEGALTADDVANDGVAANFMAIRETAPTVENKQMILPLMRPIGFAPDNDPPCAVTGVVQDRVTANSARLSWNAPDEDCVDDPARGGAVRQYIMYVSTTAPNATWAPTSATSEFSDPDNMTFETVGGIARPGDVQSVLLFGLRPGIPHYVFVAAVDDSGNIGPIEGDAIEFETHTDTSLPAPKPGFVKLEIESETHPEGKPTLTRRAEFTLDGLQDPDSTLVYHYALNRDPNYQVVRGDQRVLPHDGEAEVTIEIPPGDGDWYFHATGWSAAGPFQETTHYHVVIGAPRLSMEDLFDCDAQANEDLKVERKGGLNRLQWELPTCASSLGSESEGRNLVAIWVWRLDKGLDYYQPLTVLEGDFEALKEFGYVDEDPNPELSGSRYAIQLEFASGNDREASGQRANDPILSEVPGKRPRDLDPGQIPEWVWIVLGIALALVLAGLVIFFVLRGRDRAEAASTAAGYQWEEIGGGPSGIDQASGLPIHDIQCPSCATRFQALGHTPIEVTCPNCRISGTLD